MGFDAAVGVVGAGPAGARAAELLAAQGADVILLDPKAPWEKPCGGGLTASVLKYVPEIAPLLATARHIDRARIENDRGSGFEVPLAHRIYIVDRQQLSEWQLARALAAGAQLLRDRVRSVRRAEGGWRIRTQSGADLHVRTIVGADGAASTVRRAVAPELDVERAPTRVAYPAVSDAVGATMLLRFFSEVDGYLWDFPRPQRRSVGIGVLSGTWGKGRLDREVDRYRASVDGDICESVERAGAVIGTAQNGHGDYGSVGGGDFALLGDAAGFADPATGEGIQNALRSATALAAAYAETGTFASYPGRARLALEREFRLARMTRRLLMQHGRAAAIIEKAAVRLWAYAFVCAVSNALNEHDGSIVRLGSRWARAVRAGRSADEGLHLER